MPSCGVHCLWFAFVCFLMRSDPPPPLSGVRFPLDPSPSTSPCVGPPPPSILWPRDAVVANAIESKGLSADSFGGEHWDLSNVQEEQVTKCWYDWQEKKWKTEEIQVKLDISAPLAEGSIRLAYRLLVCRAVLRRVGSEGGRRQRWGLTECRGAKRDACRLP